MKRLNRLLIRVAIGISGNGAGPVFRFATRFPDIFIVPWIMKKEVIVIYLSARLASLVIPLALRAMERKAGIPLRLLYLAERQVSFQAAAARINLGCLMICGAIALIVLAVAPVAVDAENADVSAFSDILLWLVLGQSAPVLFGATGLFMRVVERGAFYDVLSALTASLFVVGILVVGSTTGVEVGQMFAVAQLTLAAICALLLTQCGIWPGLTAIFHREIKLF